MLYIIVPTLGNRVPELRRLLNSLDQQINKSFVVICSIQDNFIEIENLLKKYTFEIKFCSVEKKGLSFARNQAIKLIDDRATVVTFSDDDCWYPNYMVEKITSFCFLENKSYCFQIYDPINYVYYKKYPKGKISKISFRDSLKVSSIEIFLSASVFKKKLKFDENFGLGSKYPSGEENIFLFDLLKNDHIINYEPNIIVFHLFPNWINKEYIFKGKGALFARLYNKPVGILMVIIYSSLKFRFFTNFPIQFKNMLREVIDFK